MIRNPRADQPLDDLIRHHCWATVRLLGFCRTLPASTLLATAPGAMGTVARTLRHIVSSDGWYLFLLTGRTSGRPWDDTPPDHDPVAGVAFELAQAEAHTAAWEQILARPIDTHRVIPVVRMDGGPGEFETIRAGLLVAQALHHATEHRSQVKTILSTAGLEPPELGGWTYGAAVGGAVYRPSR